MEEEKTLLEWEVTNKENVLFSHYNLLWKFFSVIFIILVLLLMFFFNSPPNIYEIIMSLVVGIFFVIFYYFAKHFVNYFVKLKQVFIITNKAVYVKPELRFAVYRSWYNWVRSRTISQNKISQFHARFEVLESYEIKDGKIFLKTKPSSSIFWKEFIIFPNNNLDEIVTVLGKFIPRKDQTGQ